MKIFKKYNKSLVKVNDYVFNLVKLAMKKTKGETDSNVPFV